MGQLLFGWDHEQGVSADRQLYSGAAASVASAQLQGYATSRYYRSLVVDGTPSKLAERFYERKVLTGSHDRETFGDWRVRPTS
jgi:hypothetical protein